MATLRPQAWKASKQPRSQSRYRREHMANRIASAHRLQDGVKKRPKALRLAEPRHQQLIVRRDGKSIEEIAATRTSGDPSSKCSC